MNRLDVFILTYNRADYLGETIESILGQTFQDFRLIILDNGSTDHTREVVAKYEGVEFNPKAVNEGFYPNFMRIKELATAEWVMAFHDDDLVHPHYLENIFNLVDEEPDCLIAGCNYEGNLAPDLEELSRRKVGIDAWRFKNQAHFASFCMTVNNIAFASCIYKRKGFLTLREDGFPEVGKMNDRPIMIDPCAGGSAVVLKDIYVDYRLHPGQDSTSSASGPFRGQAIALTKYYKSVMGTDWSTPWGKSFIINNRGYLRGLHKWVSDRKDRTFAQFVRDAYRAGAATKAVFVPRPIMRRLKKHYLRRDPDFF